MNTPNFGGMSRSSGINVGMIVRVTLATFAVVSSLVMVWLLASGHTNTARAVGATITTKAQPWGEVLDTQGHLWVAEQGSATQPTNYIGEFTLANPQSKAIETPLPTTTGYSAPQFLALDANGNVWFTEPATGEIGEMVNGTPITFQNFPVQSRRSAPTDLTFDSKGNIWFTEQNGNNIGFLNPATKQVVETPVSQAKSAPYGIISAGGEIWFTESKQPVLGHFRPSATGTITIQYITTTANPHLLAADNSGNIWFTEGANDSLGKYNIASKKIQDFSVTSAICGLMSVAPHKKPTGGPTPGGSPTPVGTGTPTTCSNSFVAGIFVDANNKVWFDDSQVGRIGVFDPATSQAVGVHASNNPFDGLVVDTIGNVWASSQTSAVIIKVPVSSFSGGGGGPSPVNTTWYFAEGRVGKGFREYLTIGNPTTNPCAVNIQYLYTMDGSSTASTKTASVNIAPASRTTESVNTDLGLADSSTTGASLAAIVTVNTTATPNCAGVVAERPIYFSNFQGISSGTDVIGGTKLNTTYYFADVPTGASSSGNYLSYITILNPNATTANVTVNYFANGTQVQTQTLAVPATARGTISPGTVSMPSHVAAVVTSDQPIMVERPTYFTGVNGISGAYDVVGASKTGNDWLFAEGYTGAGYQEYLTIANVDPANTATVTVTLKSGTAGTGTTNLTLGPKSQMIWNVNQANNFSNSTPEVSAEVTAAATGASIIVQREIYFTYKHTLSQQAIGGTDVLGQLGPATHNAYNFAEGYTNMGYNTWLTLQNPTGNAEPVSVILFNGLGQSSTQNYTVRPNSRFTVDVTALVQQVFNPGTNSAGNSVSMMVQTTDGSPFVAERPMYWNTSGVSSFVTRGGSDIIGYMGG